MMIFKYQDLQEVSNILRFHKEPNVWEVEFESCVDLEYLKIYLEPKEIWVNPCRVVLEFFIEGVKAFEKVCEVYNKEFLDFEIGKKIKTIKIYMQNYEYFSICKLQAYTRKYKGLLVSITDDGIGVRIMNMLVSMYLANLSGYKFGFVWRSDINACGTDDLRNNLGKSYHYDILLPQIESEEYLFDSKFISQHSYTKQIKRESKHLARNIPLSKLKDSLPFEGSFGWSYQDSGMHILGVDKSYLQELPKLYSQIPFSSHIVEIMEMAKIAAQALQDFVALHWRGGDALYSYFIRSRGNHYKKVMPIEIAFFIIKTYLPKGNLIVFSDDIASMQSLLEYEKEIPTNFKLCSIVEFLPENLNDVDRIFFEITFMSKAKEIFSAGSHFSYLASVIGKGREQNFTYKFFDEKMQVEIILQYLEKIKIHPIAQAFSYLHLYILKRGERDFKFLGDMAYRAMNLDEKNPLYKIAFLDSLIKQERFKEADELLANIEKKGEFYKVFCECVLSRFQDIAQDIFKNAYRGSNIMKMADAIAQPCGRNLEKGAVERVREHLSYKLGEAYLQSNLFNMPFRLLTIKKEHKILKKLQKKMIERGEMNPPKPLHSFADYFEALQMQNEKEFRIGQLIIEADKSFLKFGFLTLYFKCKGF
ncbi:hypothetical protein [Helicobacter ganmani]|uniref:hypothetical protein n=5 Tax=Helicobacter ganmani TaxID=60246 RepID=UPI003A84881F